MTYMPLTSINDIAAVLGDGMDFEVSVTTTTTTSTSLDSTTVAVTTTRATTTTATTTIATTTSASAKCIVVTGSLQECVSGGGV